MEYSASLVGSLAWPIAAVIAVVVAGTVFKPQVDGLIARARSVEAGPLKFEFGAQIEAAAANLAKPNIEVSFAGLIPAVGDPPSESDAQEVVDEAVERDEQSRRRDIERLLNWSVQAGWEWKNSKPRDDQPPRVTVQWDSAGKPSLSFDALSDRERALLALPEEWSKYPGRSI
jgi:hypothetical protein